MAPRWVFLALVLPLLPLSAQAATIQVTIDKLEYSPPQVSARVGDTIEWVNKDALLHSATARNGDWDVTIGASKSARLLLKEPGTVDYYCRFHPNMKGSIAIAP